MKFEKALTTFFAAALIFAGVGPAAAVTGFQLQLAGAQIPRDADVNGFRIGFLHAKNTSVRGFDLGLASISQTGDSYGFSMILGVGQVSGRCSGLSSALINYHTGTDESVNAAFFNSINRQTAGANIGFINVTEKSSNVDISGIAISQRSKVQIGFVNITEQIDSVQIGFLNFAENGIFPVLPFFNLPKQ